MQIQNSQQKHTKYDIKTHNIVFVTKAILGVGDENAPTVEQNVIDFSARRLNEFMKTVGEVNYSLTSTIFQFSSFVICSFIFTGADSFIRRRISYS